MKGLWVPVSAAVAQQRKVETIANNVANANTPGFKKDDLVFKEHLTALEKGVEDINLPRKEWKPSDFYQHQGAQNSYVSVDGSFTNFQQGMLTPTGNPLDVGIKGKGFIEVLTPNGVMFSRAGILGVSKDGDLITERGYKVLSATQVQETTNTNQIVEVIDDEKDLTVDGQRRNASENIQDRSIASKAENRIIKVPPGKVSITLDGDLYINGQSGAKISVVEFHDVHAMKKVGNGLYATEEASNIKRNNIESTIHQGFIEQSNVSPIGEMSELIKANRHFESLQRVIKAYDTMAQRGANDIAKF